MKNSAIEKKTSTKQKQTQKNSGKKMLSTRSSFVYYFQSFVGSVTSTNGRLEILKTNDISPRLVLAFASKHQRGYSMTNIAGEWSATYQLKFQCDCIYENMALMKKKANWQGRYKCDNNISLFHLRYNSWLSSF